jgi:hypothetical protein
MSAADLNFKFATKSTHVITFGNTSVEVSTDQLTLFSLYLAVAVNQEDVGNFIMRTVNNSNVVIHRRESTFVIDSTGCRNESFITTIPINAGAKISETLMEYSMTGSSIPYLLSHKDYGQVDQELFVHKNTLGVVYITYGDDRDNSDLPIGLYLNTKTKLCYGIKATLCSDDNDHLTKMVFDEKSLSNRI